MTGTPGYVRPHGSLAPWQEPAVLTGMAFLAVLLTMGPAEGTWIPQIARYVAALMVLWLLPAAAWARRLPAIGQGQPSVLSDPLVRMVGGLGLAFVGSGLLTLALYLVPGPISGVLLRVGAIALVPLPFFLVRRTPSDAPEGAPGAAARGGWPILIVIITVTLLARLPNLGYSEFQGDEGVIMQRAAQALEGDDGQLFLHQKGPVEILIPMSLWTLTGTLNEWQVRLPFVLAGLMAVLAGTALAAAWFGKPAALVAGVLLALNGFLVAFSRIIQYQNLVVAMGALGLLWLLRYREEGHRLDILLGATFVAFGLLAHYDAVLVAPAAAAIILAKPREERTWGRRLADIGLAACAGAAILALFYVPFMVNPMFSRTFAYLLEGRVGGGALRNGLWDVWRLSTFYNSIYYIVGLMVFVAGAALLRAGTLSAWLYFAVPLIFYCFIVADPRTHIYTFYPGAAILAGGFLNRIAAGMAHHASGKVQSGALAARSRAVLGSGLALWSMACAGYVGLVFVSHAVEYKRAWPDSRHALYPVPFADEDLPPYGHFGFPYRAGWKAVEHLFATGVLHGTYASNEEPEITTWYVRSGARTMCGRPDVYVVAEQVQDEIPIDWDELERDYTLVAQIIAGGRPKIRVYVRPEEAGTPVILHMEDYAATYDREATSAQHARDARLDVGSTVLAPVRDFGDVARLLGYKMSPEHPRPGDLLTITLYWEALSSPTRNYQVFTHLIRKGELVAQHDGAPACALAPTSLWEQGQWVRDEHVIFLDPEADLGDAQLFVGVYDLLTLERLTVTGTPDNALLLRDLEITTVSRP